MISEGRNHVIAQVADYFAERGLEPIAVTGSVQLHAARLTEQQPYPIPLCSNQRRRVRAGKQIRIAVGHELLLRHCSSCRRAALMFRLKAQS